jgi:hypothetical protein
VYAVVAAPGQLWRDAQASSAQGPPPPARAVTCYRCQLTNTQSHHYRHPSSCPLPTPMVHKTHLGWADLKLVPLTPH